jgi:hypothetical protein
MEAASQEEKAMAILNGCKRLAPRQRVTDGRNNFCSDIVFVPSM